MAGNLERLIRVDDYPVKGLLPSLLKDNTTSKNIILATEAYIGHNGRTEITEGLLYGFNPIVIQPRVEKQGEVQQKRTRSKAEVFTPSWICNKMNNHCDSEWFGRKNVFNIENVENGCKWITNEEKIEFPEGKTWQDYVSSKRLEITCGEAPYLVSRYDATTGAIIPIGERIGILDRKLRIVNENTKKKKDWFEWVARAYQSVYGYEFQGDNLLIARINLLVTFVDYAQERWGKAPAKKQLKIITNIIAWNLWQMDGITGTIPYGKPTEKYKQMSIFDFAVGINDTEPETLDCIIFDWESNTPLTYNSLKNG